MSEITWVNGKPIRWTRIITGESGNTAVMAVGSVGVLVRCREWILECDELGEANGWKTESIALTFAPGATLADFGVSPHPTDNGNGETT